MNIRYNHNQLILLNIKNYKIRVLTKIQTILNKNNMKNYKEKKYSTPYRYR